MIFATAAPPASGLLTPEWSIGVRLSLIANGYARLAHSTQARPSDFAMELAWC